MGWGGPLSELFGGAARFGEKEAAVLAERATLRSAALSAAKAAANASRNSAATLTLSESGQLTLRTVVGSAVISTIIVNSADDILKAASDLAGAIFVTPDVIASHQSLLKKLLNTRPHTLTIVDEGGKTASLELRNRGAVDALVVVEDSRITFSPEAWKRRALLDQRLMRSLYARRQIIVLAPRTDQVQRLAYQKLFGDSVRFVSTNTELFQALKQATQRLVAIVGHVENGAFVLLSPAGSRTLEVSIDTINLEVERANSVALLLGCRVACEALSSGPATMIDAFAVANGLAKSAGSETTRDFLTSLAESIGPVHVDTDIYGRLRVVSYSNVSNADKLAKTASFVRMFFPNNFGAPPFIERAYNWLLWAAQGVLFLLYMVVVAGWLVAMVALGTGPKKIWNHLIKETYASVAQREEHQIDALSKTETVALFVLGPWFAVIIHYWTIVAALVPTLGLGFVALISFPLILLGNPSAYRISRDLNLGLWESGAGRRSFIHGCDAAAIGLLGSGAFLFTWWLIQLPFGRLWQQRVGSALEICLALVGYVGAIWLTRRWPRLIVVVAVCRVRFGVLPVFVLKWMFSLWRNRVQALKNYLE